MRILPSQSTLMKEKVGSTAGLTTSMFSPYVSAIGSQKATPAPPIGSAPIFRPAAAMASMRMTCFRSATYGAM